MALKQLEPRQETIGDLTFYITPFPAFKCANITGELASVLAPLLSSLAPLIGAKKGDSLFDIDVSFASDALMGISNIEGNKIENIMEKLLLGGHIAVEMYNDNDEKEATRLDRDLVNEIFCGEIQDMFILCFYVIRLNFNGFFKRFANPSGEARLAGKTPRKVI